MILTQLDIHGVRNLNDVRLEPEARFNQLVGPNGAGKSSILEAIYCLSVGHSYRTRKSKELITHGADEYSVACQLWDPIAEKEHRSGLRKHKDGSTELRLNYEEIRSIAAMTQLMPVKALTPDSHELIQDGPSGRRQFLDWGVFHVEQSFFDCWKQYRRALAQRNQSLKDMAPDDEVFSWDELLASTGETLNTLRSNYVSTLAGSVQQIMENIGAMFHVELRYKSGWTDGYSLAEALSRNQLNCRRFKTTTAGPHRAELQIESDGKLAKQVLSRGQQKLLVYAMHLAQLSILNSVTRNSAIILCDDLPSELDQVQANKILALLATLNSQVFLTSTDKQAIPDAGYGMFFIDGGEVRKEV